MRTVPTTEAERAKVAEEECKLIGSVTAIGGHGQDWDDTIAAAHEAATATWCHPTQWEWEFHPGSGFGEWTGRWREVQDNRVRVVVSIVKE